MARLLPLRGRELSRAVLCAGIALGVRALRAGGPVERIVPDAAGIARQPSIALPPPPVWASGSRAPLWTVDEIRAAFGRATSKPPRLIYVQTSFVRPDQQWLAAYVRWFQKLEKPLNLHYEDELFDCDKYSRCFVAFADLLAQKAGETRGSICVGWATVFNENAFAGISSGGAHAVVIVGSSEGLFVVEPQTGVMVPLRNYPNRDQFSEVYF